jgi:hypothetical protein
MPRWPKKVTPPARQVPSQVQVVSAPSTTSLSDSAMDKSSSLKIKVADFHSALLGDQSKLSPSDKIFTINDTLTQVNEDLESIDLMVRDIRNFLGK